MSQREGRGLTWFVARRRLWATVGMVGSLLWSGPLWAALTPQKVAEALATLERGWVANQGQWDEKAAFSAPGYFGATWVTREGELRHVVTKREACEEQVVGASELGTALAPFRKPCAAQSWVLSERWVGGEVTAMRGEEELASRVSYFVGDDPAKHRSELATYRYVSLGEVWPGVEVKLKATQKTVEKLFYLAPGADLAQVRVELEGALRWRLSEEGEILVETALGQVALSRPVAWQEKDGEKLPVTASYRLLGKGRYGFAVENADPQLPLIIDPILQSTYLGGSGGDFGNALAIAGSGDVYVAGETDSRDFPNTAGGVQGTFAGVRDAFVARLNASLTAILQSTYLGGNAADYAYAVAMASNGEVVVAGLTHSTDFPNTLGGAQAASGGAPDAFVARLNAHLTQNLQSTYLGGSGADYGWAMAVATGGEVVVVGRTDSTNFPNTAGGAQAASGGAPDAFVARLNAHLTQNLQSTYLGGSGADYGHALAVASSGEVFVGGFTLSTDFPNTAGAAQPASAGGADAVVARLNGSLTVNLRSTYLGGIGHDYARAVALSSAGEVVVAGYTGSADFPNTAGGAQENHANPGGADAFVARLNSDLTLNPQSTYLGGAFGDWAYTVTIAPAPSFEVYVAGFTDSFNFPNTLGAAQAAYGGTYDAFVARFNAALTANLQSTFLGGFGDDRAHALTIAPNGETYVVGQTSSINFPVTAGGAQAALNRSPDAFVARLTADLAGGPTTTDLSADAPTLPAAFAPGASSSVRFSCTNGGGAPATNATCGVAASAGSVTGVSCTPAVPVAYLAAGGIISCTYTFTAPGTPGGSDTPQATVTFTVTTGADNDTNPANNTATGGPVPLVDALDDAAALPAGRVGATFNVGSNDQVGTTSPPAGSSFTYLGGSCTGASVHSTTGVATFNVPSSGSCTVDYRLCFGGACDNATLRVTAIEAIPTLDQLGLLGLVMAIGGCGVLLLRRLWG